MMADNTECLRSRTCDLKACLRMSMLVLRMPNHCWWRIPRQEGVRGDGCRSTARSCSPTHEGSDPARGANIGDSCRCRSTGVFGSCLVGFAAPLGITMGPKEAISGPAGWNDCRSAGSCILDCTKRRDSGEF
ncbi:uncharacterized protein CC84DRAFT_871434 [Paraphaeosphaeria sporulosa]|uniref:Uncharacterized protein n=1 Tax=Paraphaeosphaeria sporulosa TaxID=1460663 RepID=A0A177C919_9PLEO|nr:uncharacterized protein CC84DRAFT_871434 [Paraphaeosphaeria sporulosa]OAG03876.1 hypothetical protein CC84DRAFT_871434 [Paraphaeosphaeria sporulosa]